MTGLFACFVMLEAAQHQVDGAGVVDPQVKPRVTEKGS